MRPALTLTITLALCCAFLLCGAALLSAAEPDLSPLTGAPVRDNVPLDFSCLTSNTTTSAQALQLEGLQFDVLASKTVPEQKWRIRVYSATWCGPCRRVHEDWETLSEAQRQALPFTLEFEYRVPKSVKELPTFALTARDGTVQTFEGYTSLAMVQAEFEARKLGRKAKI